MVETWEQCRATVLLPTFVVEHIHLERGNAFIPSHGSLHCYTLHQYPLYSLEGYALSLSSEFNGGHSDCLDGVLLSTACLQASLVPTLCFPTSPGGSKVTYAVKKLKQSGR